MPPRLLYFPSVFLVATFYLSEVCRMVKKKTCICQKEKADNGDCSFLAIPFRCFLQSHSRIAVDLMHVFLCIAIAILAQVWVGPSRVCDRKDAIYGRWTRKISVICISSCGSSSAGAIDHRYTTQVEGQASRNSSSASASDRGVCENTSVQVCSYNRTISCLS